MNLRQWMEQEDLTQSDAAKRLGVRQQDISRWLLGLNTPTLGIAKKVATATRGAVTMDSWDTLGASWGKARGGGAA